jgi:hypothetical protein
MEPGQKSAKTSRPRERAFQARKLQISNTVWILGDTLACALSEGALELTYGMSLTYRLLPGGVNISGKLKLNLGGRWRRISAASKE